MTEASWNVEAARLLKYFTYSHLPTHLQPVSRPFAELADRIAALPASPERSAALRKLLEAKDCAVRAAMDTQPGDTP